MQVQAGLAEVSDYSLAHALRPRGGEIKVVHATRARARQQERTSGTGFIGAPRTARLHNGWGEELKSSAPLAKLATRAVDKRNECSR